MIAKLQISVNQGELVKQRILVDQNDCNHNWLSDLDSLDSRNVTFILIKIGDEEIEFDICVDCGRIGKLVRNFISL